jgi:outer membrane protein assembly factor BamB
MRRRAFLGVLGMGMTGGCLQLTAETDDAATTEPGSGSGGTGATTEASSTSASPTQSERTTTTGSAAPQTLAESDLLAKAWDRARVSDFHHDGDVIYTGGPVSRVTVDRGIQRWTALPDVGARYFASGDGWLYAADRHAEGSVYRIDAATGSVDWRAEIPGTAGHLAVADDVVVAPVDEQLVALETSTGEIRWEQTDADDGGQFSGLSRVRDGHVYASSTQNPELHRVRASDGRVSAVAETGSRRRIQVGRDGVYVISGVGVEAYSRDLSERRYRLDVAGTPQAIEVADGGVYVATGESLHRFDASDGSREWTHETGVTNLGALTVGETHVWLATRSTVHAVRKDAGDDSVVGSIGENPGSASRNIVEHDGRLLVHNGGLHCYRITDSS